MSIREIVAQGFYYARTCRSLWLFGFFVGLASGGSSGGGNAGGSDGGSGAFPFLAISPAVIAVFVAALVALSIAAFVLRFIAEGALIEGVVRARQGGVMTTGEGFRAGWAHWGVLVRIALVYIAVMVASLAVLVIPCVVALRLFGPRGALAYGIPALLIAVPWLVTLYLVQAFASRIAVLENRRALDAIEKARLFLHGRLGHGLKLMVASLVGTLAIALAAAVVLVPLVLVLVASMPRLPVPVIVLIGLALLPVAYVLTAVIGTFRSSVWTIGYVTQVQS